MTLWFLGFLLLYCGIIGATLCIHGSNRSLRDREDALHSSPEKEHL